MLAMLIQIVGWTLIAGAFLFAWWKGGDAERWGGTLNLACNLIGLVTLVLPSESRQTGLLIADGILAFGLLILAVRYASLWIGGAMLLQAVQFMLHTYYFVLELRHNVFFGVVNNLVLVGVIVCLVLGTIVSWRKRAMVAVAA